MSRSDSGDQRLASALNVQGGNGFEIQGLPAAFAVGEFKKRLCDGDSVVLATFRAGYGSTSRDYGQVTGELGMRLSAHCSGGAGETISYAVRSTTLGSLLMAATERGVCMVDFGDDAASLVEHLTGEYPNAVIEQASEAGRELLDAWMAALDEHVINGAPCPELPLDIRGTAFQVKVWRFLMQVTPGEVVSYRDIASRIGKPRAVRAVGSACGANRLAVLVPCHRALRSDGSPGGYRWGLDRKRVLLEHERNNAREGTG